MDLPILVAIRDEEDPHQPCNQQAKKGNPQGGWVDKAKEPSKKKGQSRPDIGGNPKQFDTIHRLTPALTGPEFFGYHERTQSFRCRKIVPPVFCLVNGALGRLVELREGKKEFLYDIP